MKFILFASFVLFSFSLQAQHLSIASLEAQYVKGNNSDTAQHRAHRKRHFNAVHGMIAGGVELGIGAALIAAANSQKTNTDPTLAFIAIPFIAAGTITLIVSGVVYLVDPKSRGRRVSVSGGSNSVGLAYNF